MKQRKTVSGIIKGLYCETSVPMLRFTEQWVLIPQYAAVCAWKWSQPETIRQCSYKHGSDSNPPRGITDSCFTFRKTTLVHTENKKNKFLQARRNILYRQREEIEDRGKMDEDICRSWQVW